MRKHEWRAAECERAERDKTWLPGGFGVRKPLSRRQALGKGKTRGARLMTEVSFGAPVGKTRRRAQVTRHSEKKFLGVPENFLSSGNTRFAYCRNVVLGGY